MRKTSSLLCLVPLLIATSAYSQEPPDLSSHDVAYQNADDIHPYLKISAPFIDLRSGPGRGFPVEQSVERGAVIEVIKRRTNWFLVRTERGHSGWIHRTPLFAGARGSGLPLPADTQIGLKNTTWELGAMLGRLEDSDATTVHANYFITPRVALETAYLQALNVDSDIRIASLGVQYQFVGAWQVATHLGAGLGQMQLRPASTLTQVKDSHESALYAQAGLRIPLMERLQLRLDYRHFLMSASADHNQEIDEWKAGFAVFY